MGEEKWLDLKQIRTIFNQTKLLSPLFPWTPLKQLVNRLVLLKYMCVYLNFVENISPFHYYIVVVIVAFVFPLGFFFFFIFTWGPPRCTPTSLSRSPREHGGEGRYDADRNTWKLIKTTLYVYSFCKEGYATSLTKKVWEISELLMWTK